MQILGIFFLENPEKPDRCAYPNVRNYTCIRRVTGEDNNPHAKGGLRGLNRPVDEP